MKFAAKMAAKENVEKVLAILILMYDGNAMIDIDGTQRGQEER